MYSRAAAMKSFAYKFKELLIIGFLIIVAAFVSILPVGDYPETFTRKGVGVIESTGTATARVEGTIMAFRGTSLGGEEKRLGEYFTQHDLLRLHVIPNSNSDLDQNLKLTVRDAILATYWPSLITARSSEEAKNILRSLLPDIEKTARQTLLQNGSSQSVRVEMGTFWFPDKQTGGMIVPAGQYKAVRIVLGKGEGDNWWCVMFPPLCITTTASDGWQATPMHEPVVVNQSFAGHVGNSESAWDVEAVHAFQLRPDHEERLSRSANDSPEIRWAVVEIGVKTKNRIAKNVQKLYRRFTGRATPYL